MIWFPIRSKVVKLSSPTVQGGRSCGRTSGSASKKDVRARRRRGWLGLLGCALLLALVGCNGDEPAEGETSEGAEAGPALAFADVTERAGLGAFRHQTGAFGEKWFPEAMGSGGGFVDYNSDGWPDVLLVGGGVWPESGEEAGPALWLYRNEGDGTFTDVTEEAGLADVDAYGFGITAADYDNDGDEDVYFTTLEENKLFRNDGGAFTEVGEEAGVAGESTWSSSALFFDANRDGHLDLYAGNYVAWTPETDIFCSLDRETKGYCTPETYRGVPGRFYVNNGDGTFTDQTDEAGFADAPGKTLGVAQLDFNRDGWPDLAVASDTQRDLLYENDGDGTFTERGAMSGIAYDENGKARAGMGIDVGVVDTTGQETIVVGNFSKEMIGLYRHMGGGLFIDRAAVSKVGRPSLLTLTFGLFLFDVDLDGDLDLFAANGHVQPEIEATQEGIAYAEPPHLFLNRGDGIFEDAAPAVGGPLAQPIVARGAAYADYDRDGDLDVLVTENNGPAHLWRNDLPDRSFLQVHTVGAESNRDGIGARLVAVVDGRRMERRVRTGSSFLAQSEKTATFGLGGADVVDSLVVEWPSGQVDRFADVEANQRVSVIEASRALEPDTDRTAPWRAGRGRTYGVGQTSAPPQVNGRPNRLPPSDAEAATATP